MSQGSPLRILILHSAYRSGPVSGENRVVADEAQLLRQAGHAVELWTPSVEARGAVDLLRTGLQAVWSRAAAEEVRRRAEEFGPDVVHCHSVMPPLSPAVLRAAAAAAPVVMSLHNYRLLCLPADFLRDGQVCEDCLGRAPWPGVVHRCYRGSHAASGALAAALVVHRVARTFEKPALYLAVSEFLRGKYIAAGHPAERIVVKPNFSWPVPRRDVIGEHFLYAGRLSPEKGVQRLVKLWHQVSAPLVVLGDGPDAHRLRASAPANVDFRGAVSSTEVASAVRTARALLVPSICYEGQPRSVLEAYAAGVPVIASALGGLPEVVEDGTSGFLAGQDDDDAWIAAITRLLDDDECRRVGDGGYQRWNAFHTPELALDHLERAYDQAVRRAA